MEMRATWGLTALLSTLLASPAAAQRVDERGVPYYGWDVHAGTAFHVLDEDDSAPAKDDNWYGDWFPSGAGNIDVGRYWSNHLKTEVGLTFLSSREHGNTELVRLADGQMAYAFRTADAKQTQVSVAGSYQFFENAFAHPYVSAGARIGLLRIESTRSTRADVISNQLGVYRSVTISADERQSEEIRVRPFVAIGSKSYFNEQVFVRPELMLSFNRGGVGQYAMKIGFGFDF
jgi:hypothetical protein